MNISTKGCPLKHLLLKIIILVSVSLTVQSCKREDRVSPKKDSHITQIRKIMDTADVLLDTKKRESAYYYFNKVLPLIDPKKNPDEFVYTLMCMAEIQQFEGNSFKSEFYLTKTMPYLEQTTDREYKWSVYTIMAKNYHTTYDLKNALLYHKKALSHTSTTSKRNQTLHNIALVYCDQKEYDTAIKIYLPLLAKDNTNTENLDLSKKNYAMRLNDLGHCYYKTQNPKALDCFNESLKINRQIKNQEGTMFNHWFISLYYFESNPEYAYKHIKQAYAISCQNNYTTKRIKYLSALVKCSHGSEQKKYTLAYIHLSDSIKEMRLRTKNQFSQIKYNSKLDKAENLQLKTQKAENQLQLEREKNRNIISYILILFILILILFLSLYLIIKGRREKSDAIYDSEMRISAKLKNELSNNIYNVILFVSNENLEIEENKEQLLNHLEVIYSRTRNISKENSSILTNENYTFVLKEMISEFKTQDINIFVSGLDTIPWKQIDKNKKIILYRVLQELFATMKTHSKATLASLTFKIKDKKLIVTYANNSVGTTKNNTALKNRLQNMESRIKTINGTLIFDAYSQSGFKLSFTFHL
ncbi:tetratricopeptide repeat-containing sensor histidine kinase [Flavobacterium poyangense]|uniref:tetratricopeptide repeat-containing sensor histidine kinase n=1 Tax=Flavobacterium poyangense TaxID=2204302 RepID=UPI00141FFA88|nr:tetratricopeptide repeat-containing sensor histidine kinase [Flavobacterium sp. JXAS1]